MYDKFRTDMIGRRLQVKWVSQTNEELAYTSVGRLAVYSTTPDSVYWTFEHQPDAGRALLSSYRLEITVFNE